MSNNKKYPRKVLAKAIAASRSWRQVALNMGLNYSGTTYRVLPREAKRHGISTSHFLGAAWRTGLKFNRERSLEATLVVSGSHPDPTRLISRLVDAGLKNRICAHCSHDMWLGQPIPLVLSHKNARSRDYRLHNLEFLCPNCYRVMINLRMAAKAGSKNAKYSSAKGKKSIGEKI